MEEQTTTDAPVVDGGSQINGVPVNDQGQAIEPQPEAPAPAEAVTETTESEQKPQANSEPVEEIDASEQEQLEKFAKTKGLTLDSDNAIKAAKMAMNAEKLMHKATSKASELEKSTKISEEQIPTDATPEERDNVRVRNLELKFDIQEWKRLNPDKAAQEAQMAQVLVSDPVKRELVQSGYLSLDDLYSIATAGNVEAAKSEGKKEALTNLAQKQQAAVPTGNAVNPSGGTASQITPQNVDQLVAQNDLNWFREHYDEINRAMAA